MAFLCALRKILLSGTCAVLPSSVPRDMAARQPPPRDIGSPLSRVCSLQARFHVSFDRRQKTCPPWAPKYRHTVSLAHGLSESRLSFRLFIWIAVLKGSRLCNHDLSLWHHMPWEKNYQAARLVRRRRVTTFPASCPGSLETKSKLMIVHAMAELPLTMRCSLGLCRLYGAERRHSENKVITRS